MFRYNCSDKGNAFKNRTEPWMTAEILDLIKTRDEFLYKFKKHNLQEDYQKYGKMRNKVIREISITKADVFSNKVEENKFDSKNFGSKSSLWDIKTNKMKVQKLY